jgi:hypothetical protein
MNGEFSSIEDGAPNIEVEYTRFEGEHRQISDNQPVCVDHHIGDDAECQIVITQNFDQEAVDKFGVEPSSAVVLDMLDAPRVLEALIRFVEAHRKPEERPAYDTRDAVILLLKAERDGWQRKVAALELQLVAAKCDLNNARAELAEVKR